MSSSSTQQPLWQEVDLLGHSVIEASAGTGKTYTIEHLVWRLLCLDPKDSLCRDMDGQPRRVELDDLLVVTYTEKATEELKTRIREKLEDSLENDDLSEELSEHLRDNLAEIDRASIQTIHGFCQAMLSSYAFESGHMGGGEIIDDDQQGLSEELRRQWRKLNAEMSEQLCPDVSKKPAREGLVKIAAPLGHPTVVLHPEAEAQEPYGESLEVLEAQDAERRLGYREALLTLAKDIEQALELESAFIADTLTAKGTEMKAARTFIETLRGFQNKIQDKLGSGSGGGDDSNSKSNLDARMMALLDQKEMNFKGTGNVAKRIDEIKEQFSALFEVCERWDVIKAAIGNDPMHHRPQLRFACQMAEAWKEHKLSLGLMSFDDLIQNLAQCLRSEDSLLLKRLQERFTYGIIDEFQDTDNDQWLIFHKIFRERPENQLGSLTVVGDPKQAIYAFRGADVKTYLKATESIEADPRGKKYKLEANYRSCDALVQGGNAIFQTPAWFSGGNLEEAKNTIAYGDAVQTGKPQLKLVGAGSWGAGGGTHLYDLRAAEDSKIGSLNTKYSEWILSTIQALMPQGQDPSIYLPHKPSNDGKASHYRPLEYGDIAILLQTRASSSDLKRMLSEEGIPWREYKQSGVYSSDASRQWVVLLEALCANNDESNAVRKAMFTWFFEAEKDLDEEGLPSLKVKATLAHWRDIAHRQQWAKLLREIIEQSDVELRLLRDHQEGERHLADLRQIREDLLNHFLLGGEGMEDTANWLRRAMENKNEDGRSDIHQLESDRSKIVFITMHSAKGLEYPITFLMPKKEMERSRLSIMPPQTMADGHRKLFEPHLRGEAFEAVKREQRQDQWARLLYVSFTRASFLQFAPLLKDEWPFSALVRAAGESPELFKIHPEDHEWELEDFDKPSLAPSVEEEPFDGVGDELEQWWLELEPILRGFRFQSSFSGLQKVSFRHEDRELDKAQEKHDETEMFSSVEEPKRPTALPPGRHSGNFLHEVLETEDWSELAQSSSRAAPWSRFDLHLQKNHLLSEDPNTYRSRCQETQDILCHLLNADITCPKTQESFKLAEVEQVHRIPELEFLMAIHASGAIASRDEEARGWLIGFIDLVFRRPLPDGGHRYYILDWKSNSLPAYTQQHLQECMLEHQYDLQADIYAHALDRWLQVRLGDGYRRDQHFGGSIYAFLRAHRDGPETSGFWTKAYDEPELNSLSASISSRFLALRSHVSKPRQEEVSS